MSNRRPVSLLDTAAKLTLRRISPEMDEMLRITSYNFLMFSTLVLLLSLSFSPYSLADTSASSDKVQSEEDKVSEVEPVDPTVDKKPDPGAITPPKGHFPTSFSSFEGGSFYSPYAFLADKFTRTLSVWKFTPDGPEFVEAHPMDLGKNNGDKIKLGDKKTPEGIYFFEHIYEKHMLNYDVYGSRAFVMDYPNFFDRMERKTGSGIWLHAIPESQSLLRGSRGCVVVRDEIIQHLGKYVSLQKTPIIVVDRAEYKPLTEYKQISSKWHAWLHDWQRSWESKTLENYLDRYHSDFKSQGMDKAAWERFKKDLNTKYEYIKVKLHEPLVFVHKDEAIVRFLQSYESDQNSDFGEKYLYLKKEDGEFRIVGETWSALSSDLLAQKEKPSSPSN